MAETTGKVKDFGELEGKAFQVYLGTITYEVSLGNYNQFILSAAESNELHRFLRSASALQRRISALKEEYQGQVIPLNLSEKSYKSFPPDLISSAYERLSNLAIEINDFQVTELEFIEGSVNGRLRVVLKGTFRFIGHGAAVATIAGISFADVISKEKERISDQSCVSFGDVENNGNGDIVINVNIYPSPEKPADMQKYFSEPPRVEDELVKAIKNELNIERPRPRPEAIRQEAQANAEENS